jgi:5-formyltetrahydrofolate cyclo-ligase
VTSHVLELPEFQEAKRISVYLSMPKGEISTASIVKQALLQGKRVFVPHIQEAPNSTVPGKTMEMFALSSLSDMESLQRGNWGIPNLDATSLSDRENAFGGFGPSTEGQFGNNGIFEGLDLILLPGMAFDHSKGRLGHGKGYYDRFLQRYWELASQKNAHAKMPHLGTVFICPSFQLIVLTPSFSWPWSEAANAPT